MRIAGVVSSCLIAACSSLNATQSAALSVRSSSPNSGDSFRLADRRRSAARGDAARRRRAVADATAFAHARPDRLYRRVHGRRGRHRQRR
ncbi:MAG: hypothetical protein U0703_12165 [Anaerolineae bacterium]